MCTMQVFFLVKEALKPQALMMARNRQLHRKTEGGEPFKPLAFATVEQSLLSPPFISHYASAPGSTYAAEPSSGMVSPPLLFVASFVLLFLTSDKLNGKCCNACMLFCMLKAQLILASAMGLLQSILSRGTL